VYPSAGPYYIQSRDVGKSLVEVRNPFYKGSRPANPDRIVWTVNTDQDQSLLQVKAGQVDIDVMGPPATANASLAAQYGVNKQRFFVGPSSFVFYYALNTSRAPFNSLAARKAVNWAIDRPALVRLLGKYGARRTDQILPPSMPGYKPYNLYAIRRANPAMAKKVAPNGIPGTVVVLHDTDGTDMAQIVEYDLQRIGAKTKDSPVAGSLYNQMLGTRGVDMDMAFAGYGPDYNDPFDYINVLFDGRSIQEKNNVNFSYLNSPKLNKAMDHAASLTGAARAKAYAQLDYTIMKDYAPWVPFAIKNGVFFVSSHVHNWVYSARLMQPAYNALSVG
jgi:ABC-type transport system substrate-binding protein